MTMDEGTADDTSSAGFLGKYGVTIVPPTGDDGQWFVTLSIWDDKSERYRAGPDGPLLETRDEAIEQAGKILDWLREHAGEDDLDRIWQQMQEMQGAQEMLGRDWPPDRGPWGDYRIS